jgi:dihydrofolate reductase
MPKPETNSDRPRLTLVAVQSLDGCITRGDTPGVGFASKVDQDWFQSILSEFDSAIMGRKTYEAARTRILDSLGSDPQRLRIVNTRNPGAWTGDHRAGVLEFTDQTPPAIMDALVARGKRHTVLLGGATLNRIFLEADLVDRLWLTLEPVVFGEGRRLIDGPLEARFELEKTEQLGPSVLLLQYGRPG